jgi:hypothetical protein
MVSKLKIGRLGDYVYAMLGAQHDKENLPL